LPNSKRLHLSEPAKRDLKLIAEYTLCEWGAVQKKKYLAQIKHAFKRISEHANTGRLRDEIDKGLISLAVQKHIIFYRVTHNELFVMRVLHESMDVESHLR